MRDMVLRGLHLFPLSSQGTLPKTLPAPGEGAEGLDLILFCSSGELGVMQQQDIAAWSRQQAFCQLSPRRAFVSLACASWYAALLEFERSPCRHAEIWVIESPASFIQERLDCAGLGHGGAGLTVQPGIARMVLQKCQAKHGELVLEACALFAKPAGLRGTEQLIKRYGAWLAAGLGDDHAAGWVSFAIATGWSDQLLAGLSHWFPQLMERLTRLPSMETDTVHLLAIKPLHELHREIAQRHSGTLFITTLAAGGRIGCVVVRTAERALPGAVQRDKPHAVPVPAGSMLPGMPPDYCDPQYRYVDNQYFLTEMTLCSQCSRTWNDYE
ncbi:MULTISPECIES: hypothetical protein [Pantoea]|uniref:Uncharacterized protein n=1 Tax=Pantoea vagans TaxID=470934 RepID=A0AAN1TVJ6_9GAMM|nr:MULTISPECIES: hypothetical protein [Pantoea]AVV37535.1 hypothetical protein C9381_10185 [Pantoea vagans]